MHPLRGAWLRGGALGGRAAREAGRLNGFRAQLRDMAALQERYNSGLHPQWREQGFAFHRAVWIECAELLDHYGWKWWQRQPADLAQARLEIVDIWHFGLSDLLRAAAIGDGLADRMAALSDPAGASDFRAAVEALALAALRSRRFDVEAFMGVMNALPMTLDALHRDYVAKNVLNAFRQAHGYRDGSYAKTWGGREDNAHLLDAAAELDARAPGFADRLRAALEARYAALR